MKEKTMQNFVLIVIMIPSSIGAFLGCLFAASISISADGPTNSELLAGMGIGALLTGFPGIVLWAGSILIERIGGSPKDQGKTFSN